ncbi:fibronectin type III domain-containing protein 9-like [Ambystoma mexicanum]|uniref:fibronectin type III domain-containing protein 9-like n=1 Tax=Ambystoma mexicanum TaxID=8296 RepID=UPI0037E924E9
MNIVVKNITLTSALVAWSTKQFACPDNFYKVLYRTNWNGVLSSFSRQNFHREEMVPVGHNFLALRKLSPSTSYIICVTCQGAHPSRDQCTIFQTMAGGAVSPASKKLDLAVVIWLISSALLIIIVMVLLYGCFRMWCRKCKSSGKNADSPQPGGGKGKSKSWPGIDAETTLTEDIFEIPTPTVLNKISEAMPDALLQKTLDGRHILLPHRRDADTLAILPQNGSE